MFAKDKLNQMGIWKKNLLDQKAAAEAKDAKNKKQLESGKMYEKMVSEAVGFITAKITEDTKSSYTFRTAKDGKVTISIYSALIITPEYKLYPGTISVPTNPKTGKDYFFDSYRFKDEEQVGQFFEDVKAQLPEVEFDEHKSCSAEFAPEGSRVYSVKVVIDIND